LIKSGVGRWPHNEETQTGTLRVQLLTGGLRRKEEEDEQTNKQTNKNKENSSLGVSGQLFRTLAAYRKPLLPIPFSGSAAQSSRKQSRQLRKLIKALCAFSMAWRV